MFPGGFLPRCGSQKFPEPELPEAGFTYPGADKGELTPGSWSPSSQAYDPGPKENHEQCPHHAYPDELHERAVREVRTTGRPIAHVAKDLGIHKEALRGWVRQAEADAGERDDLPTTAEHEELQQLPRIFIGVETGERDPQSRERIFCGRTRPSPDEADQVIEHLKEKALGVGFACRVLSLSESAYYARKKRPKPARRLRDEQLMPVIEQVHAESGGTYGARRITRAPKAQGRCVARCTVERLMRELGLEGVIRGQRRRTTVLEPSAPRPADLFVRAQV
ncbi:IS3 family transposase [Streptomyces sp. NPDC001833]|uniref:IS3 family transposase n=1 Tax=Streptomyces sp. NPDC001833 TaxID=3154658 RepID=UPI003321DBC9